MFKFFTKNTKKGGFSQILKSSSSREKKQIIKEAVNSANKEQKATFNSEVQHFD